MLRSLTIPTQPVSQLCSGNLKTVCDISIAGTIDAYSGALLDERGHSSAGVRELATNLVRSMNANSRRSDA